MDTGKATFPVMETAKPAGKRHRTKYDAAFRAEAICRVTQDGQTATRVAQALGMGEALLGCWVRTTRAQLAHAKMERDIKKR
jgi:transposase